MAAAFRVSTDSAGDERMQMEFLGSNQLGTMPCFFFRKNEQLSLKLCQVAKDVSVQVVLDLW